MSLVISLMLSYRYFILLPLAVIEGPLLMMACGLLVRLGYLNFIPAYALIVIGDLFGDILWYLAGYKFGMPFVRKFGKFFNITEQDVEKVENIFHRHDSAILLLSKMTMGLGFALVTLISAGLVKIPLKKFVFWNALGGLLWTACLMAIGIYLGNFYLTVNSVLGKIGVLSSIVVIFIILISATKYIRSKF